MSHGNRVLQLPATLMIVLHSRDANLPRKRGIPRFFTRKYRLLRFIYRGDNFWQYMAKKTTTPQLFKRQDLRYGPVDKRLCRDIKTTTSRYKAVSKQRLEEEGKRRQMYGIWKATAATQEGPTQNEQLMLARKRALEALSGQTTRKAKRL